MGEAFDLTRLLNGGCMPDILASDHPDWRLDSYVADYLKEEIAAEGLVRNLPAFSDFLTQAALDDGEFIHFAHIGRECGVSPYIAKSYFAIMEGALLGRWLPAYRKRIKRRVIRRPSSIAPTSASSIDWPSAGNRRASPRYTARPSKTGRSTNCPPISATDASPCP